jgi:hypothetical protein
MANVDFPDRIRMSLRMPDTYFVKRPGSLEAGEVPAYELSPGAGEARPTGRVLVRFRDAEALGRHQADIETAGYVVEEILSYAPQAAWLRAASGSSAEGLRGIPRLERIAEVEEVEPQMLRTRALKSDK